MGQSASQFVTLRPQFIEIPLQVRLVANGFEPALHRRVLPHGLIVAQHLAGDSCEFESLTNLGQITLDLLQRFGQVEAHDDEHITGGVPFQPSLPATLFTVSTAHMIVVESSQGAEGPIAEASALWYLVAVQTRRSNVHEPVTPVVKEARR